MYPLVLKGNCKNVNLNQIMLFRLGGSCDCQTLKLKNIIKFDFVYSFS